MAPPQAATLHIVFGHSAGGGLRQALRLAGRRGSVAVFPDDLTFGPIDPPDPTARTAWVAEHLGDDWDDIADDEERFWRTALAWRGRRVVWTSRRVGRERAGFLEWVRRAGETPYDVIDLTDNDPLAIMPPAQIVASGVLDVAVPMSGSQREAAQRTWDQLRRDNAPLRRLVEGELVSAPIDVYDPRLLEHASSRWQKAAQIVGGALVETFSVGDLVLFARLRALIGTGELKARGDPTVMRGLWVRRPRKAKD